MQLRTKVRAGVAGFTVAGGAAAAALLGPAGPAVGQSSQPVQAQIEVDSPATLLAKGAGVNVLVTSECSGPAGSTASVFVSLTERAGSGVATGSGFTTIGCTGTNQTVLVVVTAGTAIAGPGGPSGSEAFKKGTAVADGQISACTADFSFCANQQVEPTITLK
jgi:hypothetical protein